MTTENMPENRNEIMPDEVNPPAPQPQDPPLTAQPAAQPAAQNVPVEPTAAERIASGAYQHGAQAADALRRGELAQYSTVDPLADSDDRLIALLSYVTQIVIPVIMPAIVLVSESNSKRPFQRYHAVQSLAFTLTLFGLGVATFIVSTIIGYIPLVGFLVILMAICLTGIGYVGAVIAMLYYGFQAYAGKRFGIPGLTTLLQDQGWLK